MADVNQAYVEASKLTDTKYLKMILSFDESFGFIFGDPKGDADVDGLCIIINKEDVTKSAIFSIIFENLDFFRKGKELPLSLINNDIL